MGQTWSNTKGKEGNKENQKRRRKELIVVVVHKVGIIEASSSAGAKLVSPKFLLGYYPITPHSHVFKWQIIPKKEG